RAPPRGGRGGERDHGGVDPRRAGLVRRHRRAARQGGRVRRAGPRGRARRTGRGRPDHGDRAAAAPHGAPAARCRRPLARAATGPGPGAYCLAGWRRTRRWSGVKTRRDRPSATTVVVVATEPSTRYITATCTRTAASRAAPARLSPTSGPR